MQTVKRLTNEIEENIAFFLMLYAPPLNVAYINDTDDDDSIILKQINKIW